MLMEQALIRPVAHAMVSPPRSDGYANFFGPSGIDAGHTYLGQMISHDTVPPTSKNLMTRHVTPTLNLDSLYGSDPLYLLQIAPSRIPFFNEDGRFKLHRFNRDDFGQGHDFVRLDGGNGIPLIAEQRNDENVIIAQLQIFWMRLHNLIVGMNHTHGLDARRITTLLFQVVVIEDFLRHFLTRPVHSAYFEQGLQFLSWDRSTLPDFFSKASFRFGHSIIRRAYRLDPRSSAVNLLKLFRRRQALTKAEYIDWQTFFGDMSQKSSRIDTKISSPMQSVPGVHDTDIPVHIAMQNIGASMVDGMPAGHEFVTRMLQQANGDQIQRTLNVRPLTSLDGATFSQVAGVDLQTLPLWPYLLLESQQQQSGTRLGAVGSMLNAEVLQNAIRRAEFSVFRAGTYDFDWALQSMGEVGKTLIRVHQKTNNETEKRLSMQTLLKFLHQHEDAYNG